MGVATDLTGKTFGSWTVIERAANRRGVIYWKCRCTCGSEHEVRGQTLRNETSTGCQKCIWKNKLHPRAHTDGSRRWVDGKPTHIYRVWLGMRSRCNYPKSKAYKNYGGRGIKVCEEWNKDFQAFFDYVSRLEHYGEDGRTIDRIDNDKGYEPGNVRWATRSQQERNKRPRKR